MSNLPQDDSPRRGNEDIAPRGVLDILSAATSLSGRLRSYIAFCGDYMVMLAPTMAVADIETFVPQDWPDEVPTCVRPPFPGELVDANLVIIRAIADDENRARAILAANVIDDGPRARELILSVAEDGGWPGAIAQSRLQPTPEEAALAARLEENHEFFAIEGRRILRNLKKHSPELLREMRMRAFPHLMQPRHSEGPSLLDFLGESETENDVTKADAGNE